MDLKLRINKLELQPGLQVNLKDLKDSKFNQVNLLRRLVRRLPLDQVLFETKNCTVDCFNDRLSLFPCTHGYLNKDRQWQTQASVLLVDGRLHRVEFRVMDGVYAAPNFMEKFKGICDEHFGDPKIGPGNLFRWENDHLEFSGILHPGNINSDFKIECLK